MKQTIETKLGVTIILIFAVTVGAFVWRWEKEQEQNVVVGMQQSIVNAKKQASTRTSAIYQQDQTKTQPAVTNNSRPTAIVKISSDKKNWKNFQDTKSGLKLSYPSELSVNTSRKDIILGIYSISHDDPYYGVPDAMIMNQLTIRSEQRNIDDVIKEQQENNPSNFTQKGIKINNISAKQISYRGAYAGELWINTLIKNGYDTIIVSYPGDNQENVDLFEKIITTIQL
ncbi:MAG: hypothetical protein WC022_00825 [Parcubacteria group bacterium]